MGRRDRSSLVDLLADGPIERTVEFRHRPTEPPDPETGQGNAHVQYCFAAHRAVVDVDVELGLVKVVEIATAQDVGKAINPIAVEGQIHGGTAQGLGLALMEEIQVEGGRVRNPSFTDYLIPTILDMPPMHLDILELADPHAPYGLRGVGEAPTISSTPAIVAAIRAATGRPLTRVPVRPEDITGVTAGRSGKIIAAPAFRKAWLIGAKWPAHCGTVWAELASGYRGSPRRELPKRPNWPNGQKRSG